MLSSKPTVQSGFYAYSKLKSTRWREIYYKILWIKVEIILPKLESNQTYFRVVQSDKITSSGIRQIYRQQHETSSPRYLF